MLLTLQNTFYLQNHETILTGQMHKIIVFKVLMG